MLHPLIWNAAKITFSQDVDASIQNFFRSQTVTIEVDENGEHVPVRRPLSSPKDAEESIAFQAWGTLRAPPRR